MLSDEARTASTGLMSPLGRSTSTASQQPQRHQLAMAAGGLEKDQEAAQEEQQEACSSGVPSVREAILGLQRRFRLSRSADGFRAPGQTGHAATCMAAPGKWLGCSTHNAAAGTESCLSAD